MSMIRLISLAAASALFIAGCAAPTENIDNTYGSPAQQQRMQQDTTMGSGMGSGVNDGQGYKGNTGLNKGQTLDKF